jgi:chromosome segregation ATPase
VAEAAPASPDLEGRIDALVTAALEKRLDAAAAPAPPVDQALAATQQELAQAREEAAQARAELAALSARLQELEGGSQPAEPTPADARLENHLEHVMRELGTSPGSAA